MSLDNTVPTQSPEIKDCWNRIGVWGKEGRNCPRLEELIHCHNCPVYSEAARDLLDREPPEEYLREWTSRLLSSKKTRESMPCSAFVFRVGREWLALPTSVIREVAPMRSIHSIPHREVNFLRGLVNIRGKLEICISIGEILGVNPAAEKCSDDHDVCGERLVVAQKNKYCMVFPVSEIMGIRHYRPEDLKDPPANISASKQAYTKGVLQIKDRDIALIEDELLFKTVSRGLT